MLTSERLLAILKSVAVYYTLTREQIQFLVGFTGKHADRHCRKLLLRALQNGLINKTNGEVVFPQRNGAPAPVYFPSRRGLECLTAETGEEKWLMCCCIQPNWQYLNHWVNVSQFHIVLDQAIAKSDVELEGWIGEWQVANPKETDPAKRYTLFTEIRPAPHRLVANPDAGFMLSYKGYRKVYYLELSRGTTGIQQIAASKTPGFSAMAEKQLHRRHFPETNIESFSVLAIEPSANRRDMLAKAIKAKAGAALWKFAAWPEITPESLLYAAIWHDCEGANAPLVRRG